MKRKNKFSLNNEDFIPNISASEKEEFLSGIINQTSKKEEVKNLDSKAKPTFGINVRFNQYQMDLIRRACILEERSQQQVIKRILIPALENILLKK